MPDIGETLRAARESRGLSIEQAAQDTRISARFIEAIEAEDFDALPAPVYVRGFLRSYSNYLRVDPQPLLDKLGASGFGAAAAATAIPAAPTSDPFATTPRARAGYEEIPQAPERTLADDGDQWWPETSAEDRGLWPDGAPRERVMIQDPVAGAATAAAIVGAAAAASGPVADTPPAAFAPRVEPEHERLRRLRETGILVEPEPAMRRDGGGGGNTRMIVIVGAAVFGLVAIVVAAMSLLGGGDGDGTPAGVDDEPTQDSGSVIPVGTATPQRTITPRVSVTPRPSTTPNPRTPTATVGPTQTPGPTTTGQPTTNPGGGGQPTTAPQPSSTTAPANTAIPNTAVPNTAVPSNTPPPTNTPIPTATQIPIPPHGSGYSECTTHCGLPPYYVYCPPTSSWFVDFGKDFTNPRGWPLFQVESLAAAPNVCG
ncbi:MAG: helix-turn-helix domain-containing protein [Tepidiformaceae bacterium]